MLCITCFIRFDGPKKNKKKKREFKSTVSGAMSDRRTERLAHLLR